MEKNLHSKSHILALLGFETTLMGSPLQFWYCQGALKSLCRAADFKDVPLAYDNPVVIK